MKLLILPGFSLKNKQWAEDAAKNPPRFEAEIWPWKHWGTGESADFSAESEARTIVTQIGSFKEKQIFILAKSIGTFVLATMLKQSPEVTDKIQKACLCGIPLNDLEKHEWDVYENLNVFNENDSICFQNDRDPHGNFAQVSNFFISKNISIPVRKKLADNHDYRYFEDFSSFFSS